MFYFFHCFLSNIKKKRHSDGCIACVGCVVDCVCVVCGCVALLCVCGVWCWRGGFVLVALLTACLTVSAAVLLSESAEYHNYEV